jgi:nitrogen fixation NifU-like protein
MLEIRELYQETILEHGQNPRNFGRMKEANYHAAVSNPLCGDQYLVYLKIKQGAINNLSFEGEGCLISKASASLMTEVIKDKTTRESLEIFKFFQKLVSPVRNQRFLNGAKGEKLIKNTGARKLAAFSGISKFPLRIKCALLPWYAMKSAILKAKPTKENEFLLKRF